jgi:hypothetical protein
MARSASWAFCGLAAALALTAAPGARADSAPAAAPSADPVFDSQKAAFDALPEADRKAIQDALVWSGRYLGVVDGAFGKRTRDAILAYQANAKAPATGVIDASQLAAMIGVAQKARAAVRFQIFTDEKTGVKIGAPLKILDKRAPGESGGARLMKADGSVTLDLMNPGGGDANFARLFVAATEDAPGRKIAFKISRPDYFVVSADEAGRKIYERVAKAPPGAPDPAALRGFRFAYPAAEAADLDKIAVAVASSFEPFPAVAGAPATGAVASIGAPPPEPPPAPSRPFLGATGFLIAPGQALTAISAADCPNPTIEGKPARFFREDRELGLSLLAAESTSAAAAPSFGALGPDLVALTYAADEPGGRIVLNVAAASPLPSPDSGAKPSVLAPLLKNSGGSPVFDRKGALVAMIAQSAEAPKLVAGVAPLAPHRAIGAEAIQHFLSPAGGASAAAEGAAPLGAGEIAAAERPYVVAISCRR